MGDDGGEGAKRSCGAREEVWLRGMIEQEDKEWCMRRLAQEGLVQEEKEWHIRRLA